MIRAHAAVWLAVVALGGVWAEGTQDGAVVTSYKACCAGAFRLKRIAQELRLAPPGRGQLRRTLVSNRPADEIGMAATSETPWAGHKRLFLEMLAEAPPLALILETAESAAGALWDPRRGRYEVRTFRGRNLLQLRDGSQIVGVDRTGEDGGAHVRIWAKGPLNRGLAAWMPVETERHLGTPVRITVGTHPLLWTYGDGVGFPGWAPAFGELGEEGIRAVKPGLVYRCRKTAVGQVWCEEQCGEH